MFERSRALWLAASMLASIAGSASAGELTVYCGVQEEWCQTMMNAFTKATGVNVAMTRKSAGEIFAQVKAEAQNPKGDIWWGGPGDPQLQAAEEGLTDTYQSAHESELQVWARRQGELSGHHSIGIYAGALGFSINTEIFKEKGWQEPACWTDLLRPEFAGEIQIANPNSSGTAYTAMSTLVQIFGEDQAFEFMKKLNANVSQYTKSGAAPAVAVGRGEASIGVNFMQDGVTQAVNGFPVKVIAPCEGTGYEVGSMSIIKGAPNLEDAKKFYDFALTVEAQSTAAQSKSYQVQANVATPLPEQAPRLDKVKLIDYDFKKYGSADERKRLLARWDAEVGSQH